MKWYIGPIIILLIDISLLIVILETFLYDNIIKDRLNNIKIDYTEEEDPWK